MRLIVGLGNPGLKYRKTRHNIGFMFVDELIKQNKEKFSLNKTLKSEIATITINNEKILVIKPQTFMNLSGEAVNLVRKYFQITIEDILVIYDDFDLPLGKIRIRPEGSAGGQKGMKNIIELLQTTEVKRLRIGININNSLDAVDFVLGKFSKDDSITISLVLEKANEIITSFINNNFENFMNRYNKNE
ncbi:MAG TPA: aminoacyl-tRNA hydrolase [Bacilli bacterium]|nr:aminoacyl-tRNA hydrolase [Bacilli bacterium]